MSARRDIESAIRQTENALQLERSALAKLEHDAGGIGIPQVGEVRLPMLNIHKAWYETTQRPGFAPYNVHPLKAEDYNLETGGDTDLGEPLVAPFSGLVTSAGQFSGSTGRIVQLLGYSDQVGAIVWAGWHLRDLAVQTGDIVFVGDPIGTIGNASGRYYAHLHNTFCVLNDWGVPSPTTYPTDGRYDWRRPSVMFVELGVDADVVARAMAYDGK